MLLLPSMESTVPPLTQKQIRVLTMEIPNQKETCGVEKLLYDPGFRAADCKKARETPRTARVEVNLNVSK